MELVLKLRFNGNASEWSRKAGLKERTHISRLIARLAADPGASADSGTMAAIADAADVSLDWLLLGRGAFEPPAPTPDRRYPSREGVLLGARMYGTFPEASIRFVESINHFDSDPGPTYWLGQLISHSAALLAPPTPPPQLPPQSPTGSDKWPIRGKHRR
jgi:hypothetical protein